MADTPNTQSSVSSTSPSSAADQARIRKERREAKIRAGGSARLNKITGLSDGVQRAEDAPAQPTAQVQADPDEVDISNHYYEPRVSRSRTGNDASAAQGAVHSDALRHVMLSFDPTNTPLPGANPSAHFHRVEGTPGSEDPMIKMLQQMMGGVPSEGAGGVPSFPGIPGQSAPVIASSYAYIWRIMHAVFALSLGLYIALSTEFTGTKIERERSSLGYKSSDSEVLSPSSVHFFYIFITAEVLLQTSRFIMEKGRVQHEGMLGMMMGFMPEPFKGYVELGMRYFGIWTTASRDAMICVFVLGASAWSRGGLVS